MANPLMSLIGNQNNSVMLQAFSAMASGQSPQAFLTNLAKSNPQLQGIDFSNLEQVGRQLCKDKNVNVDEALTQAKGLIKNS